MKKILTFLFFMVILAGTVCAKDFRFAQISDVKFSKAEENQQLQKIINDINKDKDIEFVVFTGDNIAKPSADNLKAFLDEAKKLKCPFYIALGDNDVNKLKHLSKADYIKIIKKNVRKYKPDKFNYIFEKNDMIFAVLDGSKEVIPGTNGYYKEDTLNWLDTELAKYPDKHVIILQHFPIIPPSDKETYYTYKPENYMAILAKHKNVKAVISGHFDVNSEIEKNGIFHITTASVPYYRIIDILNYDSETPVIWAQLKY